MGSGNMHQRAAALYDDAVELGVVLGFGDSYEANRCAEVLDKTIARLQDYSKRLRATPFQPDR